MTAYDRRGQDPGAIRRPPGGRQGRGFGL